MNKKKRCDEEIQNKKKIKPKLRERDFALKESEKRFFFGKREKVAIRVAYCNIKSISQHNLDNCCNIAKHCRTLNH